MQTRIGFARMSIKFSVTEFRVTHMYQCVYGISVKFCLGDRAIGRKFLWGMAKLMVSKRGPRNELCEISIYPNKDSRFFKSKSY